jgi:LPXTG-site transpeptidase (sortase) family protein
VTYDFGNLLNTTTEPITLTVVYDAVVLNAFENQDGDQLDNSAEFAWDTGNSLQPDNAGPVTIQEPDLSIEKTANVTLVRVGDTVTYTVTIRHTSVSNTDAFDVVVRDIVPPQLDLIDATLDCSVGSSQPADVCTATGNSIEAEWGVFQNNGVSGIVRFQATVLTVPAQGGITNTANVEWTSLPGDPGQISQFNTLSTERYYDPADPANNYGTSSSFTLNAVTQAALPATGFAPGVVTKIGSQPQGLYSPQNDLNLEIPALKVKLPVMGIPLQSGSWDLSWLSRQAGWLEGTAYPTLDGNSVLTAHVYLPDGQPGPFIDLGKLSWGQEIAVISNGSRYVYQVREVKRIRPDDLSVFKHEEKPWLTLLTCKEFNEETNSYNARLVVRAVLVRVENVMP